MSNQSAALDRRSDLDALRAGAMMLGIVLHASLSFFPSFWMVTDSRQESGFGVLFAAIHGFRMPLFFVMSGFFSAMLLHRRGRGSLVKHRFHRVFLPMLAGLFTIVPLTFAIYALAMGSASSKPGEAPTTEARTGIWAAAQAGDLEAVERELDGGAAVDALDPEQGATPLLWAVAEGRAEVVKLLIERGADVNVAGADGGSALIASAFLGYEEVVRLLVQGGADVNATNGAGQTALDVAVLDEGTTRYFASQIGLKVNEDRLTDHKEAIAGFLREHGATAGRQAGVAEALVQIPVFNHLWFLWFLWWLVVGYAALSALGSFLPAIRLPAWLVLSPARYLWLVPLTMVPQWFMGEADAPAVFGPDTSAGLLPIPRVFAYYAIFFGFGVLYFGAEDRAGQVGKRWWLPLSIGLAALLPLGLALLGGWAGPAGFDLGPPARRVLLVFCQAAYAWLITFGLMGLVRRICPVESPRMRYLSDSAYWLYLAHLPLVVGAQYVVRDWPIPAVAKFVLIVAASTTFLLWTYQVFVRYTWLGRFLNGPRARPERVATPVVVAS